MVSKIDNTTNLPDIPIRGMTESEVNSAVDEYLRHLSDAGAKPIPGANIIKFLELVQNVVESRQNSESIAEDKRLMVLYNDPPDEKEVDTEAITFYLDDRLGGQFGRGPVGTKTTREVKHHTRSIQQHPEHPSEKLVTMGRSFDNYIIFNIYARTDIQALRRVLWFENVMDSFSWYFKVNRILALQERAWRVGRKDIGDLSLAKYSMRYYVKTEDAYQFGSQELKRITLNMNIEEV